ncbi:MAG: diaminopimelate epimerase [Oscillospiraceae bacterium]|nr:diaminopimelate epimerase [Oscillospiraceae bacterium]
MKVWYMNGAGNDFAVVDARGLAPDYTQLALELCKLTGADGFMAIDRSQIADFKLHFYNADGSRGEMCGNGSRCICRFAFENGIAGEKMSVETDAGIVCGQRLSESQYLVKLNNPGVVDLHRKADAAYVELGDPGVPHAVTEIPGLNWDMRETLREKAKALRFDPAFPKGANANLYTWLDEKTVRILTYERGVEDYTLACGTGSASTAVVLWLRGLLPGGKLTVKNPGGDLAVTVEGENAAVSALWLEGPTEVVKEFEV